MTCSNNNVLNWIKETKDKNGTYAKDTSQLRKTFFMNEKRFKKEECNA